MSSLVEQEWKARYWPNPKIGLDSAIFQAKTFISIGTNDLTYQGSRYQPLSPVTHEHKI